MYIISFNHWLSLILIKDTLALLADHKLSKIDEEVIEYADVIPDLQSTKDVEVGLQLDLSHKFGFTREQLDNEVWQF